MTQLQTGRFKLAEHMRNVFHVVPEAGTPFEALLEQGYWAHISVNLKPGSKIEVHAEDGTYYAELLVRDAGRLYAKVMPIIHVAFDEVTVSQGDFEAAGYSVKFQGPHLQWCVLRGTDRLKDKMTKQEAYEAAAELARVAPVAPAAQASAAKKKVATAAA